MPKLTLIGLYFWICLAQKVVSGEDRYHKVDVELVLTPDKSTVPDSITSILWKHGKDKVAEWDNDFGGLDIYAAFKNRTTLDPNTGELRISGLKKTDSGVYSVEFNSKLLEKTYTLSVIKAVPKPTITSSCNANLTSCTLTCKSDTTDAEPITYRWKVGEGVWEVGVKQLIVSKSDNGKSTNGYKYTCKLNNYVSGEGEVSEPVGELFGPEPSNTSAIVVGVIVTILVLVAIAIAITGILIWKKKPEYSQDTWIEFFSKPFSRLCGSDGFQPEQVGESKTDGSTAPVGEDESKTDGSAAPVGEDESKTDGSTAPVGEDESKTNGSTASGGDLNAAEKGEANGEVSMLLNEDTVKYDNGKGAAEENSAL